MIIQVRKWVERMKFIALFLVLVVLLYQMMAVVERWVQPTPRHHAPEKGAVKAFRHESGKLESDNMADRLRLFYRVGE